MAVDATRARTLLGARELLWPERLVDCWVDLATTGDADVRPWVSAAARVEGVCLVAWALTRGRDDSDAGVDGD